MTDPFTAQPYPLFYAELDAGVIRTGRIIGWTNVSNPTIGRPVVLFLNPDGSVDMLDHAEPDKVQFSWITESPSAALAAAQKTRSYEDPIEGAAEQAKQARGLTTDDLRRVWDDITARIIKTNRRVGVLTRDATVTAFDGTTVTVTARSQVLARMLADYAHVLRDALYEELGSRWEIHVEAAERVDPKQ
ncbi:hypothetical protein AB0H63_10665 [Micromonospora echinospora]|uniref:hypothetical protein n=1 Tax=Micromonospora echinospora TaxID=1877 RepID=UPI003410682F